MARQHERTAARRAAAQVLYSGEIRNAPAIDLLRAGEMTCMNADITDYVLKLVEGVEESKPELDAMLSESSKNWSISRMPLMDLMILRLALFEILHVDVVPVSVSINEAVEMAKDFGGEADSPKFVNGMLGNIARRLEAEASDKSKDA